MNKKYVAALLAMASAASYQLALYRVAKTCDERIAYIYGKTEYLCIDMKREDVSMLEQVRRA